MPRQDLIGWMRISLTVISFVRLCAWSAADSVREDEVRAAWSASLALPSAEAAAFLIDCMVI